MRPRAMPARPARPACVLVTSGPGATNAVTGIDRRADGFHPAGRHHRPGADPPDRLGRLPGVRHGRHHPPLHQAQLPGEAIEDLPRILHEAFHIATHRPPRPGRDRHPEGRPVRHGRLCAARRATSTRPTARRSRATPTRSRAAVELIAKAKRPVFYTGGGVINSGPQASALLRELVAADRLPGHLDADGPRRLPGVRPAMARHARACTAPTRPTSRCTTAT